MIKRLSLILIPIAMTACVAIPPGDDTPAPDQPVKPLKVRAPSWEGLLPEMDRSHQVAGADSQRRGYRDDIDQFINNATTARNYTPQQKKAMQQAASASQATLLVDVRNKNALAEVSKQEMRAVACAIGSKVQYFEISSTDYREALKVFWSSALPESDVQFTPDGELKFARVQIEAVVAEQPRWKRQEVELAF